MEFCCESMKNSLLDGRTPVKYEPRLREFSLKGKKGMSLLYCPWCGKKQPRSLRSKFFETLSKKYKRHIGIGDIWDGLELDEEFKTDEWWKKRGL